MKTHRLLLALAAALLPAAAAGATLYKSVDANGVIMFSDSPPPEGARVIEERPLPSGGRRAPAPAPAPGAQPVGDVWMGQDSALARANARVDLAESALAEALRALGSTYDGMRLRTARPSPGDEARVARERANVRAARQELVALMRERHLALAQQALAYHALGQRTLLAQQ